VRYRVESFTIHPHSKTIIHGIPIAIVDDPNPGLAWLVIEDVPGATLVQAIGAAGVPDDGAVYIGSVGQSAPGAPALPTAVFRLGT
jgi:hypothetical protein